MKNWCLAGFLIILLLTASCASKLQEFPGITVPPQRIVLKGFSLLPLNEKGWLIHTQNQFQLALKKRVAEHPKEESTILAVLTPLNNYKNEEEFLRLAKEKQVSFFNPKYFKISQNETHISNKKGTDCAKSHVIYENIVAANLRTTDEPAFLEVSSLICAHPKWKGAAILVNYSQQYYSGYKDPALLEKAETVFNSIEFGELDF